MTRNNKNKKSDAGKVTVKGNGKFDKNGKLISVAKKNNNKPKTENRGIFYCFFPPVPLVNFLLNPN